ncbi:MAG TPA: GT-D fold domain-containing glycosyltransferase [Synergistales bacterium]|nr:GT-D fold domain-containing glycosyltransferase [Synergistales bacterium]
MKKKVVMGERRLVAALERMIRTETDQDRTLHLQSTLKEIQGKRTEKAPSKFVVEAPAEPGNSKGMVIHRIVSAKPIRYKVNVLSEWKTLERVLNRVSLSRWGDGEIKHLDGRRNVSQVFDPSLQLALRRSFECRDKRLLVAIPNVFGNRAFTEVNPDYIASMHRRFGKKADPKYIYGSSYISRGDLNPYLAWPVYWGVMEQIWSGRDVVVVRGHEKRAAPPGMLSKARNIAHVETPPSSAWNEYQRIFRECLTHNQDSVFLLCVGPTATVLAVDLALKGRWAVDIGHLGMFYKKLGIETDEDRQVWNHRPSDPGYIKGVTDQC